MTTTQHWTQLAARNTLIRELEELEQQKNEEIYAALDGTVEQKLALLNSLQSYANRISRLESQIYKFHGDNSPEYVIESGTSGSRTLVNESNLRAK